MSRRADLVIDRLFGGGRVELTLRIAGSIGVVVFIILAVFDFGGQAMFFGSLGLAMVGLLGDRLLGFVRVRKGMKRNKLRS